jgi:hypothetical protein
VAALLFIEGGGGGSFGHAVGEDRFRGKRFVKNRNAATDFLPPSLAPRPAPIERRLRAAASPISRLQSSKSSQHV